MVKRWWLQVLRSFLGDKKSLSMGSTNKMLREYEVGGMCALCVEVSLELFNFFHRDSGSLLSWRYTVRYCPCPAQLSFEATDSSEWSWVVRGAVWSDAGKETFSCPGVLQMIGSITKYVTRRMFHHFRNSGDDWWELRMAVGDWLVCLELMLKLHVEYEVVYWGLKWKIAVEPGCASCFFLGVAGTKAGLQLGFVYLRISIWMSAMIFLNSVRTCGWGNAEVM